MLEKFVASLLVPYLSKYVENIDEGQLEISLWSGKASLSDLILKASVLDELLDPVDEHGHHSHGSSRLPLYIHRGMCKGVSLNIPYKSLGSQPVVVEIEEVLLILSSVNLHKEEHSEEQEQQTGNIELEQQHSSSSFVVAKQKTSKEERWNQIEAQKSKELEKFEEIRRKNKEKADKEAADAENGEGEADSGKKKKKSGITGYFTRLGERIVNNVIVKVKTVHVRYEDMHNDFIAGAILGNVQLLTVDEATGLSTFTDPTGLQRLFKRLEFDGLQFYCEDSRRIAAHEEMGNNGIKKT